VSNKYSIYLRNLDALTVNIFGILKLLFVKVRFIYIVIVINYYNV